MVAGRHRTLRLRRRWATGVGELGYSGDQWLGKGVGEDQRDEESSMVGSAGAGVARNELEEEMAERRSFGRRGGRKARGLD